jgi:Flp pilus assembly pilin Flp
MYTARVWKAARRLWRTLGEETGAGLAEYGIVVVLIAVVVMAAAATFGVNLTVLLQESANAMP